MEKQKNSFNWTKWIFHLVATIVFIYSFYAGNNYVVENVMQQQVVMFIQFKYLLIAIFLEISALNYK